MLRSQMAAAEGSWPAKGFGEWVVEEPEEESMGAAAAVKGGDG